MHPKNNYFNTLIDNYGDYLQTLGFTNATVYNFSRLVTYFLEYLHHHCGIHHITELRQAQIMVYYKHLETKTGKRTGRAFSTSHLNRNFLAIDKFLAFLESMGMQNTPLPTGYSLPHQAQKKVVVLTLGEVKQLFKAVGYTFLWCNLHKRKSRQATYTAILHLCYSCGLRRSEATNVLIKDVDLDKGVLLVRQGKNYKDRYIPLNDTLVRFFEAYIYQYRPNMVIKRPDYLYPFKATAVQAILPNILKGMTHGQILTKKPTLHSLRHSIATHLLANGMPIERIAHFLGHSSITVTQQYTHLLDEL